MSKAHAGGLCLLRIHYGGAICGSGRNQEYHGGMVREIEIDPDLFCYFDLLEFCKSEGFNNMVKTWWLYPGKSLATGLKLLWNDATILEMTQFLQKSGPLDLFMEHAVDVPEIVRSVNLFGKEGQVNDGGEAEHLKNVSIENENGDSCDGELQTVDVSVCNIESDGSEFFCDGYETEYMGATETEPDEADGSAIHLVRDIGNVSMESDWLSAPDESEDLEMFPPGSSEDDGSDLEIRNFPKYSRRCQSIQMGMIFSNAAEFKEAVALESFRSHRPVKWVKNCREKVRGKCANGDCPWEIYASVNNTLDCFQVKTLHNEHTCNKAFKNPRLTAEVVAAMYSEKIRKDPTISRTKLQEMVRDDLQLNASESLVRRAKAKVIEKVSRNYKEEFGQLWDYAAAIRESNPGSCVKMQVDRRNPSEAPIFGRFFIMFDAVRKGFLSGCRKFLGLDGCFLKSLTKGELLTAVGVDGNNSMYPVAWAVVEVECTESWRWFMSLLKEELDMGDGFSWTLISDQQKVNCIFL